MNLMRNIIDNKAEIKATKAAENELSKLTTACSSLNTLIKDNVIDAIMIGIDSNIENLAALSLS